MGVAVISGIVFALDVATGSEISFSIFYVLPVAIVALRFGQSMGLAASVGAAAAWFVGETLTRNDPALLIPFWNSLVRLGFFTMIAVLIVAVRDLLRDRRDEARIDSLTGVPNARGFRELAEREFARARRSGQAFTVAYVDLDHFKRLNDSAGHSTGDAALKRLGAVMLDSVRTVDVVGRLGGDEFALFLPDTTQSNARMVIERLQAFVGPVCAEFGIGTSIGVVTFTSVPESVDEALRQADGVMYDVKAAAKGTAIFTLQSGASDVVRGDEAAIDVEQ